MTSEYQINRLERIIADDKKLSFTILSYAIILLIYFNSIFIQSPAIGAITFIIYFIIGAVFLGAIFGKEGSFSRFLLGSATLIALLGVVSWAVMIAYNLDPIMVTIALFIVTTMSSIANKRSKKHTEHRAFEASSYAEGSRFTEKHGVSPKLHIIKLLYLFMVTLLFYLLFASRSGEVYTVWQVLHPAFLPLFFLTTVLLVGIVFSSVRLPYKLLFIIIHSIVTHSFFVTIFPAGDVGVQQVILGKTLRIYENISLHGYGGSAPSVLAKIYAWLSGNNFQSAYTITLARMFSVDPFWSHLLLIPILWSVLVPTLTYLITKTIGASESVSILASLLTLVFPAMIYWGTFSVPNSLGFIFALGSILFFLRYISSPNRKNFLFMILFCFTSLLSHYLTGILCSSLFILAITLRQYEEEKTRSPKVAKYLLIVAFVISASLLPMALIYQRLISPMYTSFSLSKLSELNLSPLELIGYFVLGSYIYYGPLAMLVNIAGPILGFAGMLYIFRTSSKERSDKNPRMHTFFVLTAFLLIFTEYRILKFFMEGVPFRAERVWLLRDFIAIPYLAIIGFTLVYVLQRSRKLTTFKPHIFTFSSVVKNPRINLRSITLSLLIAAFISGWITTSIYYAYPHIGPLQTTSYELEAVKFIEMNTNEKYVVIADLWIIYAGQMIVGMQNPRAFYFSHENPKGWALFIEMKTNPTPETMVKAMEYNNSTIAFFIIEKPRLGAETYSDIIQQARQNGLQTYPEGIFYYKNEEKLRIFYYQNQSTTG